MLFGMMMSICVRMLYFRSWLAMMYMYMYGCVDWYLTTGSSPDTMTLNLAGAFLLNTQDYSFLSSHNTHFEPGKVRLSTQN